MHVKCLEHQKVLCRFKYTQSPAIHVWESPIFTINMEPCLVIPPTALAHNPTLLLISMNCVSWDGGSNNVPAGFLTYTRHIKNNPAIGYPSLQIISAGRWFQMKAAGVVCMCLLLVAMQNSRKDERSEAVPKNSNKNNAESIENVGYWENGVAGGEIGEEEGRRGQGTINMHSCISSSSGLGTV